MKTSFLILIGCLLNLSGISQTMHKECDSLIKTIIATIELKHCYEASLELSLLKKSRSIETDNEIRADYRRRGATTDPQAALISYKEAIVAIKQGNKDYEKCLAAIMCEGERYEPTRQIIVYDFENTFRSIRLNENMMSELDYLKVFKHNIFDLNMDILPPLKDAVEFLKAK